MQQAMLRGCRCLSVGSYVSTILHVTSSCIDCQKNIGLLGSILGEARETYQRVEDFQNRNSRFPYMAKYTGKVTTPCSKV